MSDFRQRAAETLERLNQTGEAEILTVNGEARAALLSPAVYDEMAREVQLSHDLGVMRRAMEQIKKGQGREAKEVLNELREELAAKKKR